MVELLQRGAYQRSVAEAARGAGFKFQACAREVPQMKLAERGQSEKYYCFDEQVSRVFAASLE